MKNAPLDATPYRSAYLSREVKVSGAQWRYPGLSGVPASVDGPRGDPACSCMPSHLDADLYGRVYAPSGFFFSVEMIDAAGNPVPDGTKVSLTAASRQYIFNSSFVTPVTVAVRGGSQPSPSFLTRSVSASGLPTSGWSCRQAR